MLWIYAALNILGVYVIVGLFTFAAGRAEHTSMTSEIVDGNK
jgi:hypothetical protein